MSAQPSALCILVVGAGIGGLAVATRLAQTGHNVSVYERRPGLVEFGAGIQCPPNVMRIFKSWNLAGNVGKYTSEPDKILVRRYENGEVKGIIRTPSACVLHRADLQRVLYEAAITAGATILFGKHVTVLNADEPSLTFEDGSTAVGDLIVGADGMPCFPLLSNHLNYNVLFCK
jgi:salicylate hydroxylase